MRRPRRETEASALVLVLAVMMVLLAFGVLLRVMTGGAHREVNTLSGHLRAVAVGEAAFAEVIARIAAEPWTARWFAGNPVAASQDGRNPNFLRYARAEQTLCRDPAALAQGYRAPWRKQIWDAYLAAALPAIPKVLSTP